MVICLIVVIFNVIGESVGDLLLLKVIIIQNVVIVLRLHDVISPSGVIVKRVAPIRWRDVGYDETVVFMLDTAIKVIQNGITDTTVIANQTDKPIINLEPISEKESAAIHVAVEHWLVEIRLNSAVVESNIRQQVEVIMD